jgi:sirohydrochlorin cobaltochelatase
MALWMLRALVAENICVRRSGLSLFLPAGPDFRMDFEIRNVITSVAKVNHYWQEHMDAAGRDAM